MRITESHLRRIIREELQIIEMRDAEGSGLRHDSHPAGYNMKAEKAELRVRAEDMVMRGVNRADAVAWLNQEFAHVDRIEREIKASDEKRTGWEREYDERGRMLDARGPTPLPHSPERDRPGWRSTV